VAPGLKIPGVFVLKQTPAYHQNKFYRSPGLIFTSLLLSFALHLNPQQ
jgi:hypothetical protein